ncbi:hypothetical protein FRC0546_00510 [Corynebacterium diphtheriae]|nr:hypothetical protein FRC0546_00510 [Corynebacterium diphtheriae]
MHVSELPEKSQDYLKNVWDMHEATGKPVSLGELASRMSQKTPTASEAVKNLLLVVCSIMNAMVESCSLSRAKPWLNRWCVVIVL